MPARSVRIELARDQKEDHVPRVSHPGQQDEDEADGQNVDGGFLLPQRHRRRPGDDGIADQGHEPVPQAVDAIDIPAPDAQATEAT